MQRLSVSALTCREAPSGLKEANDMNQDQARGQSALKLDTKNAIWYGFAYLSIG